MKPLFNSSLIQRAGTYLDLAQEVLLETFWPTRCALCDQPGVLLCEDCRFDLPYIDYWKRCPRCGAPLGGVQCTECNPVMLFELGMKSLPFSSCVSALHFEKTSARLITTYKDKNEQYLSEVIALMICKVIPPEWLHERPGLHVSFIPASVQAYNRRGFDHAERLAIEISRLLKLPLSPLFARPASKDQRTLSRHERIANMERLFQVEAPEVPQAILLIDDVYTTGSTLSFASQALLDAGAERVYCATFARVW